MKNSVYNALLALCLACALPFGAAFADEPETPGDNAATENAESANETALADDGEGTTDRNDVTAEPAQDPFEMIRVAAAPITSISRDALFQHQYDWTAVENLDFESANEGGSLSEWQQDWFITHDWSDYGHVIANLEPGDAVTVNGQTILILGREQWPKETINWDVYDAVGWDKTIFQTCLGDYAIWIAYGIPVHPTQEFLAAHGA